MATARVHFRFPRRLVLSCRFLSPLLIPSEVYLSLMLAREEPVIVPPPHLKLVDLLLREVLPLGDAVVVAVGELATELSGSGGSLGTVPVEGSYSVLESFEGGEDGGVVVSGGTRRDG